MVELDGVRQKVAVADGDANLRLGDPPRTLRGPDRQILYFAPGDIYLQDFDGSGSFAREPFNDGATLLGSVLYFGTAPYHVALAADRKSIQVESWPEPVAELSLQPQGSCVRQLSLPLRRSPESRARAGQDRGA